MANFFLIDQSLRDNGGHHYDYAICIANAAKAMGFVTTIGTNRRFPVRYSGSKSIYPASDRKLSPGNPESNRNATSLDQTGTVRRVFHETIYQGDSHLAGLQQMTRRKPCIEMPGSDIGWWKNTASRIRFYRHWRRREKFVRQFSRDCDSLFRNSVLTPSDHVFLTTVSELELMGLAIFLSNHPQSIQSQWHLQFHFNLFAGRPPEYGRQSAIVQAVRQCFLSALSRLSYHAVNFYTTSDELADQYNRLGVGDFQPLPYPVAAEFSPLAKTRSARAQPLTLSKPSSLNQISTMGGSHHPGNEVQSTQEQQSSWPTPVTQPPNPFFETTPIRVTCPGGIRREKGHANYLQALVDEIYEPLLATGQVQLQLQRPIRKRLRKEKLDLRLPNSTNLIQEVQPLVYHQHPLPRADYAELIRNTDVGLLFYDSSVYYSRRAGVLGELLSCGKPVIVPAGCWLAQQIQEPIFAHADSVIDSGVAEQNCRQANLSDLRWESCNAPMHGGVLTFDADRHPFNFELPAQASETAVGIRFDWHWPTESGVYCRIELTQFNSHGEILEHGVQVVGHREYRQPIALFGLSPDTASLKFSLKNAFHDSTASVKNIEVTTIVQSSDEHGAVKNPVGAVGVIAADRDQLSNCLIEVIENLPHYRQTAESFAHQWYAQNEPNRTVARLISKESTASKVA